MIRVSYNANGLRTIDLRRAIDAVARAGYDGIELSLHPAHLDPFNCKDDKLASVAQALDSSGLPAICLATGADALLGTDRFEPSLIHPDHTQRCRRIDLIKRAVDIANELRIPVVNLASGILRPEMSGDDAWELLTEGVQVCLEHASTQIILALEPEPGFLIETNEQALALITKIGSPGLRLNQDVGHENVAELNYLATIRQALPVTRHMHVEDILDRRHAHLIPGEGHIDFTALMKMLLDDGYPHFISVELYNHADVYQHALSASLTFLRAKVTAVAQTTTCEAT